MAARYCLCCGKRYDTKPMCPACVKFRNQIVKRCASISERSGFHQANADRAIAALIRELILDEG
jgi:hypothetical protein